MTTEKEFNSVQNEESCPLHSEECEQEVYVEDSNPSAKLLYKVSDSPPVASTLFFALQVRFDI